MCYCEGIEYFISNVFRVSHFADGPLGRVSQTPAHWDQCILYRAEESLFWGKHACSLFTTSLRMNRGVICAVKTFCSRVIDPEMSNLWISCQLYRTFRVNLWACLKHHSSIDTVFELLNRCVLCRKTHLCYILFCTAHRNGFVFHVQSGPLV